MSAEEGRASPYLAILRMIAVVGMALAIALGTFLLVGGSWQPGLISLAAFVPFYLLMRLLERSPSRSGS
jgi:hypothetical protein